MGGRRFISRSIVFHPSLTSLLKLSVARSICLYSFSNRARSTTDEKSKTKLFCICGQLSLDVSERWRWLYFRIRQPCASSVLNDTLSTARRLRAASDCVECCNGRTAHHTTHGIARRKGKAIAGFTITGSTSYPLASARGQITRFRRNRFWPGSGVGSDQDQCAIRRGSLGPESAQVSAPGWCWIGFHLRQSP